jgi:chorismate mutase
METKSIQKSGKVLIAGPCSAETQEQVLQTALAISSKLPNAIFRAGVWKPRTRPGTFEGVGGLALQWLKKVREQTGLKVITEVGNAKHVECCLEAGIDMVWIGARTTANPFSVQEIAEALRGTGIPVLVKNPVNAELSLWIGALERLELMGLKDLTAIHRGGHTPEKKAFRNDPNWDLAIELKLRLPEMPLICDPSHICGNKELLPYVAQKAMDLGLDGLMIETHITPALAWSDAAQQVTPEDLIALLNGLEIRSSTIDTTDSESELVDLRIQIGKADDELLNILFQRIQIAKEIGQYKKRNNLSILQLNRWEEVLKLRLGIAQAMGLNLSFVEHMYKLIHSESIRSQSESMNA